jgi:hypothetical protein
VDDRLNTDYGRGFFRVAGRYPEISEVAKAQLIGIPALDFLRTSDQFEAVALQAVSIEAWKILDQRDENLAQRIANRVGELFKS